MPVFSSTHDVRPKWARLMKTNPQRVIDTFDLPHPRAEGIQNRWGDTCMDIPSCARALEDLLGDSDHPPLVWENLVRAGIIDRLCECVAGLRETLSYLFPDGESIIDVFHTPYYCSFKILLDATRQSRLRSPLTPTNLTVIATLRRYWPSMMRRIWDDPQYTPDSRRAPGRGIAQLVAVQVAIADPSFCEMMRSEEDLTLCVSVRYLMSSMKGDDFMLLRNLTTSIYPLHVRNSEEVNAEGFRVLFRAVKKGAGSFRNFLSKLEFAFAQFQGREVIEAFKILHVYLTYAIYHTPCPADNDATEPSFLHTVTTSVTLWRKLFLLLNRVAHDRTVWGPDEAGAVYERVLDLLGSSLSKVMTYHSAEAQGFISALTRAGLFDALDVALPIFASTHKEVTIHCIPLLMASIREELSARPAILHGIRKQLPRPRSVRALLDSVYSGENRVPIPRIFSPSETYHHSKREETKHILPWYAWFMVEINCSVEKQCMRRGCTNRRRARCKACMLQEYCGSNCQSLDWAEHRLVCGFAFFTVEKKVLALQMPFRFSTDAS